VATELADQVERDGFDVGVLDKVETAMKATWDSTFPGTDMIEEGHNRYVRWKTLQGPPCPLRRAHRHLPLSYTPSAMPCPPSLPRVFSTKSGNRFLRPKMLRHNVRRIHAGCIATISLPVPARPPVRARTARGGI
jgi:hypothetical protein